jgi:colicin import membrane protein
VDSKRNEYYGWIWAKIKEEWKIPENLFKEMVDLETIIIVIISKDGRIQKYSYDKRSGNPQYDEVAMRAIKKAEPLPPIPKELNEDTMEIGLRFTPEDYQKGY